MKTPLYTRSIGHRLNIDTIWIEEGRDWKQITCNIRLYRVNHKDRYVMKKTVAMIIVNLTPQEAGF